MKLKLNTITRCLGAVSFTVALSYSANATETTAQIDEGKLEHITVTSTKRTQSINDIPMSIQAISGDQLQAESIEDLGELSGSIPNLMITETLGTTQVSIRGMGAGTERSLEQSVSMFIDGIYMPRSRQYRAPFLDTERVEVLRGTQAVLFGLNSTAGAISVVSKKNTAADDFNASVSVDHETEYAETVVSVAGGGGVTDTLGLRLAVQQRTSDGFGENTYDGSTIGEKDETLVRLSGVWNASEDLTVTAKIENTEYEVDGNLQNTFTTIKDDLGYVIGRDKFSFDENYDASMLDLFDSSATGNTSTLTDTRSSAGLEQESTNVAVEIAYDINDYTLTANIGYSDFDFIHALDLDSNSYNIIPALLGMAPTPNTGGIDNILHEAYEQNSFELRLASPVNDNFSYIVGAYFQSSDLENQNSNIVNLTEVYPVLSAIYLGDPTIIPPGYDWVEASFEQETDAFSVFANATWNITDSSRLIFGARYITEDKEHNRTVNNQFGFDSGNGEMVWTDMPLGGGVAFTATNPVKDDRTSENFMPEVMYQFDFNDDVMMYAKAGTSAKSGGFAASVNITPEQFEYDDEQALGFELGTKMSLLEGDADLNVAVFRTEYDDLQVNTFDPITAASAITNAGESLSQGIEVEARWMLNDWLMLGGSLAYLDAEYTDYENGSCNQRENLDAIYAGGECTSSDKSDQPMPFSPEYSGKLYADIEAPITDSLVLTAGASVQFSDEFYTESSLDEVGLQESFEKVNARIGIKSVDNIWSVNLLGKNLNDEITLGSYQPFLGTNIATFKPGRTVNVQFTYNFDG